MDFDVFQQSIRDTISELELQEYLQQTMGVGSKTISRWISGSSPLPLEVLDKLGQHEEAGLALSFSAHKLFRQFHLTPFRQWKLLTSYRFRAGNNSIVEGIRLLEAFEVSLHPIQELSMKLLVRQGGAHPRLGTMLSSSVEPVEIEAELDCSGWKYELPSSYQAECGSDLKTLINQNLLEIVGMDLQLWWKKLMAVGELEHSPILLKQRKE